ncbi:MAG TPA: precorrin-3B synthase [Aliidongia sp.]|uniref:precorrin-3B synthase n=1 Tax=Aliidongia sp. TaxID=1914230 RepID=UPI002DDD66D5|nr:precorrin-3B synthase [Aliidongia sp.]HEV2676506.1 precorrin-3B synthase [Aliidongia sp.]
MIGTTMMRPLPFRDPAPEIMSDPQSLADFCPGILHAVPARDGLLMRLRLPGGGLAPATLAAIADLSARHGDGRIDLTARANIQLRGIRPDGLSPMVDGLTRAGLLPSPAHDRVRNILVSPFAGVDPDELLDLGPLAGAVDRALIADAGLARLPAKFAFTLDGGGRGFDPGGADLTLTAVTTGIGSRLHLSVAGRSTGLGVPIGQAAGLLLHAAHALLAVADTHGLPARGRAVVREPAALDDFLGRLTAAPCPAPIARATVQTFGILPETARDHATLLPVAPLGRITADQAGGLAELAIHFGFDMKLTAWRNLALRHVARSDFADLSVRLATLGLALDGRDGFAGIAACTGSTGCAAALADVRADAKMLATALAGTEPPADWSIHFAGCAKRCALRGGAKVDLIATRIGYDVLFDGKPAHAGLPLDLALAAARTAYRTKAP